jgi:hypothetical protein
VNELIQQQSAYLRQLKIDDNETMECNQKMNELINQIEEERKNIKKSIIGNQIMKFEANKTKIDKEILGTLILSKYDFTVVILIIDIFFLFLMILTKKRKF